MFSLRSVFLYFGVTRLALHRVAFTQGDASGASGGEVIRGLVCHSNFVCCTHFIDGTIWVSALCLIAVSTHWHQPKGMGFLDVG